MRTERRRGRDRPAGAQLDLTVWRGCATEAFTSPEYIVAPFDRAVVSWNATGPAVFELLVDDNCYCMGEWGPEPRSRKSDAVAVDMLSLQTAARSFRFCVQPAQGAAVTLVAVAHWRDGDRREFSAAQCAAWGKVLAVPERSQYEEADDPGKICSPTALAMVLEFHGVTKSTREVAAGVYDHAERVYGNWPFNTAYAHQVSGMEAFVRRGSALRDLEAEIEAGRPVIISHKWHDGGLDAAPLPESDGHLIVVAGFTADGDVVVNDPAGKPGAVRRTYKRRQVYTTWLERGSGAMYCLVPVPSRSAAQAQPQ